MNIINIFIWILSLYDLDAHHNLPHFPWKRIDLMSQADKVTSKRRGQFETYLKYLVEVRAFYSETIANVLLQFLEVRLSYFTFLFLYGILCSHHNVFSIILYSHVYSSITITSIDNTSRAGSKK